MSEYHETREAEPHHVGFFAMLKGFFGFCEHEWDDGTLIELGMRKLFVCRKCDKIKII